MTDARIRPARAEDMAAVAAIFAAAFPESLAHTFAKPPPSELIADAFRVCLAADPPGFLVAEDGAGTVVGYVFAPLRLSSVWWTALRMGHLSRWTRAWVSGRLPLGRRALAALVLDKVGFLRSALDRRFNVPARILSIAVRPTHQGRGLGGRLLAAGLRRLDEAGAAAVRLEVRPGNVSAVTLYRRAGFEPVGSTADSQGPWLIMLRRRPRMGGPSPA